MDLPIFKGGFVGSGGSGSSRISLNANTTFYFNADTGVNSPGNGLTSLTPWKTLQYGCEIVQSTYDLNGFMATMLLQTATATYTGMSDRFGYYSSFSSAVVYYKGDVVTPTNTKIGVGANNYIFDKTAADPIQVVEVWANGLNIFAVGGGGAAFEPRLCALTRFYWGSNFGLDTTNILVSDLGGGNYWCRGNVNIGSKNASPGTITFVPSTFTTGNPYAFYIDSTFVPSRVSLANCLITTSGGGTLTFTFFLGPGLNAGGSQVFFNCTMGGSIAATVDYGVEDNTRIDTNTTRALLAGSRQEFGFFGVLSNFNTGGAAADNGVCVVANRKQIFTPVNGGTATFGNDDGQLVFKGAGTIATYTIVMKPNPFDRELVTIFASTGITAVTWNGNGNTIVGSAPAGIPAGTEVSAYFDAASTTWYVCT